MKRSYERRFVLAEMLAETAPGRCICCDEPIPPPDRPGGRRRVLCGDAACSLLRQKLYGHAYWSQVKRGRGVSP